MSVMPTVFRSSRFKVIDHVCQRPRTDRGCAQDGEPARIIFTRRGVFAVHVGRRTCFARPGKAVLVQKNTQYRISHPDAYSHDCCTDVWIDDAVIDPLGMSGGGAPACREFVHDLSFQRMHVELMLALRRASVDVYDADEMVLDALACLCDRAGPRERRQLPQLRGGWHAWKRPSWETRAQTWASMPSHSSPLCRMFRRHTGLSLRQFRRQHRVGNAMDRLGNGEQDLAALACDVGFSSHSHMTEAFRQTLGVSPRLLREELRHSDFPRLKLRLRHVLRTRQLAAG